jgi:hypothetical protein
MQGLGLGAEAETPHNTKIGGRRGSEFRVQGSGFRVQGSGFRVQGVRSPRKGPRTVESRTTVRISARLVRREGRRGRWGTPWHDIYVYSIKRRSNGNPHVCDRRERDHGQSKGAGCRVQGAGFVGLGWDRARVSSYPAAHSESRGLSAGAGV